MKNHFAAMIAVIVVSLLSACGSAKYLPVETVKVEYQDNIREIHTTDSVTDTRFIYVKGDTVIDYRDRVKWHDRYVHDSIYIENNDTVRIPYPVERDLTHWEKTKMDFGGMAIGSVVFALCIAVVWLIKSGRK